jgi:hypothetical protein
VTYGPILDIAEFPMSMLLMAHLGQCEKPMK